jgi:monovalent cation:H+ antiporter-2, CPA2 family
MHDAHAFLQNLALVLCVAAVTTVLFQRLKQPVVFGYLLAGLIVGPYIPVPLVADVEMTRTLSELGVILLLFSIGLEFSFRRLLQLGPTVGLVVVAECGAMIWLGYVIGQLFGWTTLESVYTGAIVAISSTTIIAKAFEEQNVRGKFTDVVFGVVIIEDLIGIFLIAVLTTVSAGSDVSARSLAVTAVRLGTFLVGLIGIGLLVIPRLMRMIVRMNRPETTLVASIGICFAAALTAIAFDYPVALGAFIAGALIAESGHEKVVEHLVRPVRDMFGAIFFVAVGMLIDPRLVAEHWLPVLVLTVIVILGKVGAVTVSSFLTGYGPRTSVQAGMSLAQIGEFSFIIAAVGLATGATRGFLYPVAVAVSAITTLTTPWLIRAAGPAAEFVDRRLPPPLQTFASLYGSWIERLRSSPAPGARAGTRRLVRLLVLDTVLIAAVVIGASLEMERFAALFGKWTGASTEGARFIVLAAAVIVGAPLVLGLVQTARRLGLNLALKALPASGSGVDLAAAPRRALVVTLQLALVAATGIVILAVTQPFIPVLRLLPILLVLLVALGIAFWRSATDLEGHARAGAEVIAATLSKQMAGASGNDHDLDRVHSVLPGLGEPVSILVPEGSPAAGRTLADLNLRGVTGATVMAILHDDVRTPVPAGTSVVYAGDVLAVAGTHESIDATRALVAAPAETFTES